MHQVNQPFQLLSEWSSKVDEVLESPHSQQDLSNLQSSIGFILCGQSMSSSVGDVIEIMNVPKYTFVPGAKEWVVGIANVRGTLLPIVDLERFFGSSNTASRRVQRVLVVENDGHRVGLLVSTVTGLQHISNDDLKSVTTDQSALYSEFVELTYEYDNQKWLKFEPSKLFSSQEFMDASLSAESGSANVA